MKKFLIIFGIFCGLVPGLAIAQGDCSKTFSKPSEGYKIKGAENDLFCYLESDLKTWKCLKSEDPENCVHNTVVCMIGQYIKAAGASTDSSIVKKANRNCRRADSGFWGDSWEQYGTGGADLVPDCTDPRWKSGTGKSHEAFINTDTQEIMNNGKEFIILDPNSQGSPERIDNICIGFICDDASHQKPNSDGSCTGSDSQPQPTTNTHPILQHYLDKLDCE